MQNFRFISPTQIIFGKGVQEHVGEETKKHGTKILLHYGGGHIKKTGLYDEVTDSLKKAGVDFIELGGVMPNPRLSLVREGIDICRKNNVDFILAVGGGSVIDSAKAIAVGVYYEGDVWDFYLEKAEPKKAMPLGVVLTIAAAGSEGSMGSVISDEKSERKNAINYDIIRPAFAIMNPELTFTLPPYQTACGVTDIMMHVMERYFTTVPNVELTDRLCEAVLKTAINNVPKVLEKPDDYDARAQIMWAGTVAHNDLLTTGRIGDWASHRIEHELSAINDVAHGAGLAVIFPAWMKYVYKTDIQRFVQFAVRVWNVDQSFFDEEQTALEGIKKTEEFFKSIGMPTRLNEIGITDKHFDRIAERSKFANADYLGNFVQLKKDDILGILKFAEK